MRKYQNICDWINIYTRATNYLLFRYISNKIIQQPTYVLGKSNYLHSAHTKLYIYKWHSIANNMHPYFYFIINQPTLIQSDKILDIFSDTYKPCLLTDHLSLIAVFYIEQRPYISLLWSKHIVNLISVASKKHPANQQQNDRYFLVCTLN